MADTSPKPLVPPLPDWLTNATAWLWLVVVAAGAYLVFKSRGKRD